MTMNSKHVEEPWMILDQRAGESLTICGKLENGYDWKGRRILGRPPVAFLSQCVTEVERANASRIVSCVNACAGINPEAVPELLTACKEMLAYIEMKMAHGGCFNVQQIIDNLKHDVPMVASVETSHHLGCPQTTRRVNLTAARAAIAKAEGKE